MANEYKKTFFEGFSVKELIGIPNDPIGSTIKNVILDPKYWTSNPLYPSDPLLWMLDENNSPYLFYTYTISNRDNIYFFKPYDAQLGQDYITLQNFKTDSNFTLSFHHQTPIIFPEKQNNEWTETEYKIITIWVNNIPINFSIKIMSTVDQYNDPIKYFALFIDNYEVNLYQYYYLLGEKFSDVPNIAGGDWTYEIKISNNVLDLYINKLFLGSFTGIPNGLVNKITFYGNKIPNNSNSHQFWLATNPCLLSNVVVNAPFLPDLYPSDFANGIINLKYYNISSSYGNKNPPDSQQEQEKAKWISIKSDNRYNTSDINNSLLKYEDLINDNYVYPTFPNKYPCEFMFDSLSSATIYDNIKSIKLINLLKNPTNSTQSCFTNAIQKVTQDGIEQPINLIGYTYDIPPSNNNEYKYYSSILSINPLTGSEWSASTTSDYKFGFVFPSGKCNCDPIPKYALINDQPNKTKLIWTDDIVCLNDTTTQINGVISTISDCSSTAFQVSYNCGATWQDINIDQSKIVREYVYIKPYPDWPIDKSYYQYYILVDYIPGTYNSCQTNPVKYRMKYYSEYNSCFNKKDTGWHMFLEYALPTPTPTPTRTQTPTISNTPSYTPTKTPTQTNTPTRTSTPNTTKTATPTVTNTPSVTPTSTPASTVTPSVTKTATPSTSPIIITNFNKTGIQAPVSYTLYPVDSNWRIVALPSSYTSTESVPYNAYIYQPPTSYIPPIWIGGTQNDGSSTNGSKWIGPRASSNSLFNFQNTNNTYNVIYETSFNVSGNGTATIRFSAFSDNEVLFYVDGTVVTNSLSPTITNGIPVNQASPAQSSYGMPVYELTTYFTAGTHRLRAVVKDAYGAIGLIVNSM